MQTATKARNETANERQLSALETAQAKLAAVLKADQGERDEIAGLEAEAKIIGIQIVGGVNLSINEMAALMVRRPAVLKLIELKRYAHESTRIRRINEAQQAVTILQNDIAALRADRYKTQAELDALNKPTMPVKPMRYNRTLYAEEQARRDQMAIDRTAQAEAERRQVLEGRLRHCDARLLSLGETV